MLDSLRSRPLTRLPVEVRLSGRILFLTDDAAAVRRQLAGDDLPWPVAAPLRDNISTETGLYRTWPAGGPKVLWKTTVTDGYAGAAIKAGRALDPKQRAQRRVGLDAGGSHRRSVTL